ncbi:unnamed protein product [Meloidogyne enterolobii]|uniref:Uncharacterized protein n=1 Tax=Meloidogyne enterolobii TaxID=390850 RepID=A0ACB0YLS7_MELEN
MFYSLPIEVQFDVLKCLNFNQLFSFKQINFYSLNLINKYENELARMKFDLLYIKDYNLIEDQKYGFRIIAPESVTSEFILNDQLLEKWEAAIAKSIPLFLHNIKRYNECTEFSIRLFRPNFNLKLPNIQKNIEEMIIIRFWLEQFFKCAFIEGRFRYIIFNPQMINLLFDNDKTIPLQFNIKEPNVQLKNNKFDDFLKFTLNHLANSANLKLDLFNVKNLEQYADILFNILTNEGNKFPKVYFECPGLTKLCDLIIEYITTSKDCSKMVPVINLYHIFYPKSKLKKLAKTVESCNDSVYQIANIYNPKVKFVITNVYIRITIERM